MISIIRANFIFFKLFVFFILNLLLCLQIFILVIYYNDDTDINYFTNIISCSYITITYLSVLYFLKYPTRLPPNTLLGVFSSINISLYFISLAAFIVNIKGNNIPPNNTLQWISTIWFFILSIVLGISFKIHKKIILLYRRIISTQNTVTSENINQVVVQEQNHVNQTNNQNDIIFIIVDVNKIDHNNENCSICMLSLTSNIPVKTSCNHIFHNECIMKNINVYKNNKCPLCRTEICSL